MPVDAPPRTTVDDRDDNDDDALKRLFAVHAICRRISASRRRMSLFDVERGCACMQVFAHVPYSGQRFVDLSFSRPFFGSYRVTSSDCTSYPASITPQTVIDPLCPVAEHSSYRKVVVQDVE